MARGALSWEGFGYDMLIPQRPHPIFVVVVVVASGGREYHANTASA
jgi:hypothetical protein